MKILIIYDVEGWAYWRRAKALQKYAPEGFEVTISPSNAARRGTYDLVFNLEYVTPGLGRVFSPEAIQVVSYNSGLDWRHELWQDVSQNADYIVVNNRLKWEAHGRQEKTCNISNGVDLTEFKNLGYPRETGAWLWTGSRRHAEIKGYKDIVQPLMEACSREGIPFKVECVDSMNPPMRGDSLVRWYNSGTFFLCTSKSEGTPNPLLEAMACGCIPISTPVGNAPEIIKHGLNGIIAEQTPDAFIEAIKEATKFWPQLAHAAQVSIKQWDWKIRSRYFFALFKRLIEGHTPKPFSWMDVAPEEI